MMTIGCSCGWKLNLEPGWDMNEIFAEHYRNVPGDHFKNSGHLEQQPSSLV